MRILFFGENESMRYMAESLTNVEAVYCGDFNEALVTIKNWDKDRGDELQVFVAVLDFSLGVKLLDKFAKKTKKIDGFYRCVFAYAQDLDDLKVYQKTKWACEGQLLGPLSLQALQDIVSDFETVYYSDELDEAEEVEFTQLESDAAKELENLDQDKEDYDTTESSRALPDEFRQKQSAVEKDATASQEISALEDPEKPKEVSADKVNAAIFPNNPTHTKIQEVFDRVFQDGQKTSPSQNAENLALPVDEGELEQTPSQSEADMAQSKNKDEEIGLEFDLPEDDLEENLESKEETPNSMPLRVEEEQNDGGEDIGFDFDFDESEEKADDVQASKEDELPKTDAEEDALAELNLSEEDQAPEEQSIDDLLGGEEANNGEPIEAETQKDEGGPVEFDMDESDSGADALGLSQQGDAYPETAPESQSEAENPGDLNLEEDDDGLNFELGGASDPSSVEEESPPAPNELDLDSQEATSRPPPAPTQIADAGEVQSEEEDDFGDLDLSSAEDSEDDGVEATKVATEALEGDSSNSGSIGEDTKDKVDRTISEIVAGDLSQESSSDEDATGEFDLPDGLPAELTDDMMSDESTDSQDFSADEWNEEEFMKDSVGEDTNPTMVTSGHDLKQQVEALGADEQDEDEEEVSTGFEIDDDEIEDDFDFDAEYENLESEQEELDKTAVQSHDQTPREFRAPTPGSAGPKSLSSYGEDELTRLQSTIRQLREERDESHKQIQELKKENRLIEQQGLNEKAELDELKIELSILKKRHKNELEEQRYQLKLAEEKKQIYEERCRNYQKEFERLNQKVRVEFNQVKQREKELESQLELVAMDSESQVQSRDNKILELKRKIDSLEFNMENASIREQKSREDKARLEERLTKIMSTLRGSIQLLEDEEGNPSPILDGDKDDKI